MPLNPEAWNDSFGQFDFWEIEPETAYSAFRLNLDLRIGIAYNWKDYFIGSRLCTILLLNGRKLHSVA